MKTKFTIFLILILFVFHSPVLSSGRAGYMTLFGSAPEESNLKVADATIFVVEGDIPTAESAGWAHPEGVYRVESTEQELHPDKMARTMRGITSSSSISGPKETYNVPGIFSCSYGLGISSENSIVGEALEHVQTLGFQNMKPSPPPQSKNTTPLSPVPGTALASNEEVIVESAPKQRRLNPAEEEDEIVTDVEMGDTSDSKIRIPFGSLGIKAAGNGYQNVSALQRKKYNEQFCEVFPVHLLCSQINAFGALKDFSGRPFGEQDRKDYVCVYSPGYDGTSYSAAIISGLAGNLNSRFPNLTLEEIRSIICTSCHRLVAVFTQHGFSSKLLLGQEYGNGLVCGKDAIYLARFISGSKGSELSQKINLPKSIVFLPTGNVDNHQSHISWFESLIPNNSQKIGEHLLSLSSSLYYQHKDGFDKAISFFNFVVRQLNSPEPDYSNVGIGLLELLSHMDSSSAAAQLINTHWALISDRFRDACSSHNVLGRAFFSSVSPSSPFVLEAICEFVNLYSLSDVLNTYTYTSKFIGTYWELYKKKTEKPLEMNRTNLTQYAVEHI